MIYNGSNSGDYQNGQDGKIATIAKKHQTFRKDQIFQGEFVGVETGHLFM